jgi:hypothetical protein
MGFIVQDQPKMKCQRSVDLGQGPLNICNDWLHGKKRPTGWDAPGGVAFAQTLLAKRLRPPGSLGKPDITQGWGSILGYGSS